MNGRITAAEASGEPDMGTGDAKGAVRKAAIVWTFVSAFLLAIAAFMSSRILAIRSAEGQERKAGGPQASLKFEISRRPFLSFGFRNFLADMAWLEAVQVSGSRKMESGDYDRLYLLIRTVINYDPRFVVPYILGGLAVGDSPSHVREAMDILQRGRENHPTDWRLPFYIGYLRYFVLGDPVAGGEALGDAAGKPDSPAYLPFLAARMLSEGRRPETAMEFLTAMALHETDPVRKQVIERRMTEVIVERDIQDLERAAESHLEKTGRWPETFADLQTAGLRARIPVEPNGGEYLLSPGGKVRSSKVSQRLKVFRRG
jgi:hypothetical protein